MDYTLNQFQNDCLRTTNRNLNWEQTVTNCIFGAMGETAEISEHFKKHWFHGHNLDTEKIKLEIGDALFYLAWLADTMGFDFDEVGQAVISKLSKRYNGGFTTDQSLNRKND